MLFVLTLRSDDLTSSPALGGWLAGLGRDVPLARLGLGNLSLADTRQLVWAIGLGQTGVEAELPSSFGAFSQQLFDETAGQPLFIVQTLRSLAERGLLRRDAAGEWEAHLDREIPSGVKELIRGRLAHLSPGAQVLCAAGAVLGDGFEYGPVCRVADLPEDGALPSYEELLARRLLREAGRMCVFTHDRIREVAYDDLSAARRRRLHGRALEALEATGAPPAALAHHALAAGLDARAFELSLAAGDEALRLFAVADAIRHYQTAQDLQRRGSGPGSADLRHLLRQLARAHELNTDWPAAGEAYEQMLATARKSADPVMECVALNGLATLAAQAADYQRAKGLLHAAQAVAEASGDRQGLAESEWALAQLGIYQIEAPAAYAHGQRALALARELGGAELTARCLNVVAFAELALGEVDGVMAHGREASERFAALGNRVLQADASKTLAEALMRDGRLAEGIALARSAMAICEELDNVWGQASCLLHIACGLADQGDYGAALQTARRAEAVSEHVPYIPYLVSGALGAIHRAVFDLEGAFQIHQAGLQDGMAHHLPPTALAMFAAELCADCVAAGDWDQAAVFGRQAAANRGYGIMPTGHSLWPETLALARAGEMELASADVARFGETMGRFRRCRVSYLWALAALAEARGEQERARGHLREALSLAEAIGLPGELWLLHAALGEDERAREILRVVAANVGDERLAQGFAARAAQ